MVHSSYVQFPFKPPSAHVLHPPMVNLNVSFLLRVVVWGEEGLVVVVMTVLLVIVALVLLVVMLMLPSLFDCGVFFMVFKCCGRWCC